MNNTYRDNLYEMTTKNQAQLLGKEDSYRKTVTEGGNYKCFQYHLMKQHELIRQTILCEAGDDIYSTWSPEQRKEEGARLRSLVEAHQIKANIFATACGSPFC